MASEAFVLPPWGFQSSQRTKKTPLHLYIHNSPLMHFEMPLNLHVSQHKIYYAIGEENGGTSPRHHKYKAVVFRSAIYQSSPISGIFFSLQKPYLF